MIIFLLSLSMSFQNVIFGCPMRPNDAVLYMSSYIKQLNGSLIEKFKYEIQQVRKDRCKNGDAFNWKMPENPVEWREKTKLAVVLRIMGLIVGYSNPPKNDQSWSDIWSNGSWYSVYEYASSKMSSYANLASDPQELREKRIRQMMKDRLIKEGKDPKQAEKKVIDLFNKL